MPVIIAALDLQALIGLPDGPTVGYLRLHYFSSEGTTAFTDALRFGEFYGVAGWLIDLRNNPGMAVQSSLPAWPCTSLAKLMCILLLPGCTVMPGLELWACCLPVWPMASLQTIIRACRAAGNALLATILC